MLGDKLADTFAIAVRQLENSKNEIDINKLKQLVGVMKDLNGLMPEGAVDGKMEEKQDELISVIKSAVDKGSGQSDTNKKEAVRVDAS